MSITVHSYSRHIGGRLITVRGYQTNARDPRLPTMQVNRTNLVQQFADRGEETGIAGPGLFAPTGPDIVRGEGGLASYVFYGHKTHEPMIRWRRSAIPDPNNYKIPNELG